MAAAMQMAVLRLLLLAPLAQAQSPAPAAKRYPVTKVVTLLKDMSAQLAKEAEEDEEIYDKMACWCTTNDKTKSQAILDAEARITDLTSAVEELTATSSRLTTEIEGLKTEVAANKASLDTATALREKQAAEFHGEEKDMLQSIKALEAAIIVLSKHHPETALLAGDKVDAQVSTAAQTARVQLSRHSSLLLGVITPHQKQLLLSLTHEVTRKMDYSPQSGEIFGILRQMKETFTANLNDSQKQELENSQAFTALKTAKEAEISAGEKALEQKTQQLATAEEKLAQSKEDIVDTKASLSADEQFLMDLKERCQMTDQEWETRQKTRNEEMTAISEAIAILTDDAARDNFSKTFNPTLLQRKALRRDTRRARAAAALLAVAAPSPKIKMLAEKVKIDAFTKVKQAIDDMVAELVKQKEDEIKHKDFCTDELNQNTLETEQQTREQADVEARLSSLEMTVSELKSAIEVLETEIADLKTQLTAAEENRVAANKDYQVTVADQAETQSLLHKAVAVLKSVYTTPAAAALVQRRQAPPSGFSTYKKNEGSAGVIGLLEQIIAEAAAMEADAHKAEADAKAAYEEFVTKTNADVAAKEAGIVNKTEDMAKADAEIITVKGELEGVKAEITSLGNDASALHTSCDFVLKNFDLRQAARDEEIDALKQAKAILSGANFEATA